MKVLYIESKLKNQQFSLPEEEIKKLPKTIFLAYSIQYKGVAEQIKKLLLASNIKITKYQQVLGCSKIKTNDPVLLIGGGRFHSINLFLQAPSVYLSNGSVIEEISKNDIENIRTKLKTSVLKFLNANNIGILVSTKPGQENLDQAIKLKQKLEKKGKQAYIFLTNNIDIKEFENYNIESWVNTACSGLSMDTPEIINYNDLIVQKLI